jgi:ABC-2 type transport system permease protein
VISQLNTGASAFLGLLNRDLRVLRRSVGQFAAQIVIQPLLLVFTFTYVLPHIGLGFAAGHSSYATLLVPGLLAATALSTGISTVTTPLSTDLGGTHEIDDRVLAPISIAAIAREKILVGAVYAWLSALMVFPLCELVSATPVQIHIQSWPLFTAVFILTGITSGALGLTLGTLVKPHQIGLLYGVLLIPIQFLGCVYYPWSALQHIHWFQIVTLANPLTYLAEGTRAALTPQVQHLSTAIILLVSLSLALTLTSAASVLLRKRVQA